MNVLVTGSAGFIGSVLVSQLLEQGDRVIGIDREVDQQSPERYQLDLSDHEVVSALGERLSCSVDVCIHLASENGGFLHNASSDMLPAIESAMIDGVALLCRALSCEHIIYSSSISVFEASGGFQAGRLTQRNQHSPYGRAKALGEEKIQELFSKFTIVRPTNVFGKKQIELYRSKPRGYAHVIPELLDKIESSDHLEVFGDGSQTRNFIHVSDVVSFIIGSLRHQENSWNNIRSDIQLSIDALVALLCRHRGVQKEVRYRPEYLEYEPARIALFDNSTAAGDSSWLPKVSTLLEGLSY